MAARLRGLEATPIRGLKLFRGLEASWLDKAS
jgi:hypothetical protein